MKQNLIKTIIENKRKGLFLSHFFLRETLLEIYICTFHFESRGGSRISSKGGGHT